MPTAANRTNMLYGLDRLATLVLGNGARLDGTGLGLSDNTSLPRGDTFGTWQADKAANTAAGVADFAWFGTSANLMDRYTLSRYGTSINLSSNDITYTWRAGQYGGRIQQAGNPYDDLWWKFQKGTEGATGAGTGTLTLGTDNPNGTNYTLTHATAPWISTIYRIYGDATPQAGLARVAAFVAQGGKTNMANIHLGASSLASLFTAANGYTALSRFNGAGFDLTNVTSLASMFDGVSTLTQVTAVDHWTTGNVTSMAFMFRGCTNLESISTMRANATTGAWDVSKVTTFESMFENCERLGDLTAFADWNVHGAVNLANMFKNAKGTTDLDVSGWDTTAPALAPTCSRASRASTAWAWATRPCSWARLRRHRHAPAGPGFLGPLRPLLVRQHQ